MLSVRGIFRAGVAEPTDPVDGRDGQRVIITFVDENAPEAQGGEVAWSTLEQLVEDCAVDTGIPDLAHQHDHYLYGTPKRE
jgi:hypothetical protein